MTPLQIFETASQLGISFCVDGEKLIVSPRDKITDQLRSNIRQHKPDLIRALTAPSIERVVDIVELLEKACEGLCITPEQLWRFLSPEDIADIRDGEIDFATLRAYAERCNDHPHAVPVGNSFPYPG